MYGDEIQASGQIGHVDGRIAAYILSADEGSLGVEYIGPYAAL